LRYVAEAQDLVIVLRIDNELPAPPITRK
jgi:hypothetical protein